MAKVYLCPGCQTSQQVKYHCTSRTCVWFLCTYCNHATDIKSGRSIEIKKPRDGGMRV